MNLTDLYKDVSLEIISKLDDFSKIQLLKTCKHFYNLHKFIIFNETYEFSKNPSLYISIQFQKYTLRFRLHIL